MSSVVDIHVEVPKRNENNSPNSIIPQAFVERPPSRSQRVLNRFNDLNRLFHARSVEKNPVNNQVSPPCQDAVSMQARSIIHNDPLLDASVRIRRPTLAPTPHVIHQRPQMTQHQQHSSMTQRPRYLQPISAPSKERQARRRWTIPSPKTLLRSVPSPKSLWQHSPIRSPWQRTVSPAQRTDMMQDAGRRSKRFTYKWPMPNTRQQPFATDAQPQRKVDALDEFMEADLIRQEATLQKRHSSQPDQPPQNDLIHAQRNGSEVSHPPAWPRAWPGAMPRLTPAAAEPTSFHVAFGR